MTERVETLAASDGELLLHTGVTGRAARMGHRLTIAMTAWRAEVSFAGDRPTGVRLTVEVDSLQVRSGEGGLTPLSGPEKALVRSNALKCLAAQRYPQIRFAATDITATADGYRLAGQLDIHGQVHPHTVDVVVDPVDDADDTGGRRLRVLQSTVRQTDYGVTPFSQLMGSLKVADDVTVSFSATLAAQ